MDLVECFSCLVTPKSMTSWPVDSLNVQDVLRVMEMVYQQVVLVDTGSKACGRFRNSLLFL